MGSNEDMVMPTQGVATPKKGKSLQCFITEVNASMIIWVNYG